MNLGGVSAGAAVPLNILPYKHDVKKFNGSDPNYYALDFIELC